MVSRGSHCTFVSSESLTLKLTPGCQILEHSSERRQDVVTLPVSSWCYPRKAVTLVLDS